ncbi:zinc finger protein OZF-like [Cydia amplana]|uniref:zinc finger protein OZF-like n=1 Tax=Cydia amplana TaxID=1869771 RepID=UPI002FE68DF5
MEDSSGLSECVRVKEEPAEPDAEPEHPPPGAAPVHIKEELQNGHHSDSLKEAECVKQETECGNEVNGDPCSDSECGVSEAAMLSGLDNHGVKDEVVQPELVPSQTASCSGSRVGSLLRDCCVTLERLPHVEALAKRKDTTHTDTESDTDELYAREKEPICDLCGEKFSLKSDLLKHVMDHIHSPSSAEQEGSGHSYAFAGQWTQEHERALCRKHAIRDCCVRLERLQHHEALAANDTQNITQTDTESDTEESFASNSGLNGHIRIHPGFRPYLCDVCKKGFRTRTSLKIHTRIHSGEKPYTCKICGKSFASKSGLNEHIRTHHGLTSYYCGTCGKRFPTRKQLNRHLIIHTDIRPYSCDVCEQRFKFSSYLKIHIRIHGDIRPYLCEVCEKRFRTGTDLKIHTRIHTGEKPYTCKICGKSFACQSGLDRHIRIHTGIRPYSCDTRKLWNTKRLFTFAARLVARRERVSTSS